MKEKKTVTNHLCLWFLTAVRRLWWAVLTQCWVVVLVLWRLVYPWVDFCPLVVSCLELFLPCSLQLQQVNLSVNLSLHGQMFISDFIKLSVATVDRKMFMLFQQVGLLGWTTARDCDRSTFFRWESFCSWSIGFCGDDTLFLSHLCLFFHFPFFQLPTGPLIFNSLQQQQLSQFSPQQQSSQSATSSPQQQGDAVSQTHCSYYFTLLSRF